MPATDPAAAAWMGEAVVTLPPENFVRHVVGEQFMVSLTCRHIPGCTLQTQLVLRSLIMVFICRGPGVSAIMQKLAQQCG